LSYLPYERTLFLKAFLDTIIGNSNLFVNIYLNRDIVRAGDTGALAPTEICQGMWGTRSDMRVMLLIVKHVPELNN